MREGEASGIPRNDATPAPALRRHKLGWLSALFIALLALCSVFFVLHYASLLPSTCDVTLNEAPVDFTALRFAAGGPIYIPPNRPPYTATLYGPLLYMTLGELYRAFPP
jgi:hypothetical protein